MSRTIPVPTRQLPANFGPLKDADATAHILGPCGDTMQFWLRIEEGRILQANFTTDGCSASILSGAMAASLASGRTLREACAVTAPEVEAAVGGLPEDHKHCPVLAVNTLQAAISQYRRPGGQQEQTCPSASQGAGGKSQAASASGATDREPGNDEALNSAIHRIRYKILVLSGKGGVGKSTVAANLAMALASAGCKVGLLDIDIHGPSIPKLMGLEGSQLRAGIRSLHPVEATPNLAVMSMGFLLQSPRDAVVWRGPLKAGLIRQFLAEVAWGDLDVLVVDSPPGTGDEPLSIAQMLGPGTAAIVVTTPQAVAVADVRRSVTFCQKLNLSILGIIENMSGFSCPHCGKASDLFGTGGGEDLAREMDVPFLGRIPLDPQVVLSGDAGTPFVQRFAQSASAKALNLIIQPILTRISTDGPSSSSPLTNPTEQIDHESQIMKIAIPVENDRLNSHFGGSRQFAIVEVDPKAKTILRSETLPAPKHEPGAYPRWLHSLGVQVIIAGGIGQRALTLFAEQGINVVAGQANELSGKLVEAYLSGGVTAKPEGCAHHGEHHDHGHEHGHQCQDGAAQ
jgi:ATP-binding protein involved in chromosome partitioning